MYLLRLALASLSNRRLTATLTALTIALSVCLLLAVERVRTEARSSFANTISGSELIVGARAGSINLLLYSIFRIGNATHNIRWDSFEHIANHPQVSWAIPLSLGDSHKGFRVLGTNTTYFQHYRYGHNQALAFTSGGQWSDDPFSVVLGADVAQQLNYSLGNKLVLAHGTAKINLHKHDDNPFKVVGILQRTGTPVDRTLHISLPAMQAIHSGWQHGVAPHRHTHATTDHAQQPEHITAMLLGLKSKIATFNVQREINAYSEEPLLAIIPGVALQELWSLMSTAEQALLGVSTCVVITGLIGMLTAILSGLNERRREMAILRSVGARPWHVAALLIAEAWLLALIGCALGVALLYISTAIGQSYLQSLFGFYLPMRPLNFKEWTLIASILTGALLIGCLPAWRAYRNALVDGLSIRS